MNSIQIRFSGLESSEPKKQHPCKDEGISSTEFSYSTNEIIQFSLVFYYFRNNRNRLSWKILPYIRQFKSNQFYMNNGIFNFAYWRILLLANDSVQFSGIHFFIFAISIAKRSVTNFVFYHLNRKNKNFSRFNSIGFWLKGMSLSLSVWVTDAFFYYRQFRKTLSIASNIPANSVKLFHQFSTFMYPRKMWSCCDSSLFFFMELWLHWDWFIKWLPLLS